MKILSQISKWINEGVKVATDWAEEPLKKWQHDRDNEVKKIESEIKQKEMENKVDLKIKQETEIKRIIMEIEQAKKDKEFERWKAVSEAIIRYQSELAKINADGTAALGNMSLELRDKAQELVYNKTRKYKELQHEAFEEAVNDSKRIETEFPENEKAKSILYNAVDKKLATIIDSATIFIQELNQDLKSLNTNIDLLAQSGQNFIIKHLQEFKLLGISQDNIDQISSSTTEDAEIIE